MKCKICFSKNDIFAEAKILRKYDIKYFRCTHCGFIQTEEPYWLEEAYSNAIASSDIGLVTRNIHMSEIAKVIAGIFFEKKANFLDYGGGYGLFVRIMRDAGFDFYRYDKYCTNLFSQGFDISDSGEAEFELVTAFELFEHLQDPLVEIDEILKYANSILFSTDLVPDHAPKPGEWWYYAPDTGQHISFYTKKSLEVIAERLNLNIYNYKDNIHLLTKKKIPDLLFKAVLRYRNTKIIKSLIKMPSLLEQDYNKTLQRK